MFDDVERIKKRVAKAWNERQKCLSDTAKSTGRTNELLRQKFKVLNEKYWLLQGQLEYYESSTIEEDNEIEIKRIGDNIENRYGIFLKNKKVKMGSIDYQGYHNNTIEGDIGYFIDSRYNGHNYAYKALCLLSSYLYKNGINDFYISVFHDNIPSIKIIKKYGGDIIYQDNLITIYQCQTREKEKALNK